MEKQDIVLSLGAVTKKVGKQTIVNNLSFHVNKGEIVGLLGPNGAGKTTTIRMIVGLIKMTSGDILIEGNSIRGHFAKAISNVGAIVENPEFYPYMTGWDNLKQYQRMTVGITEERIKQVVDIVGLAEAMNKKVKSYSLGIRQRLGIAQALLHSPSILILDEPTNGLDPAGIREMRDYLKQIAAQEGIGILVSSHLLSEMEIMCNRVVIIQQGKYIGEQVIGAGGRVGLGDAEQQLVITVGDVRRAEQAAAQLKDISFAGVNEERNEITISCSDDNLAQFIFELSSQRIAVYRISEVKRSLEDEFLARTGGNQIV